MQINLKPTPQHSEKETNNDKDYEEIKDMEGNYNSKSSSNTKINNFSSPDDSKKNLSKENSQL